MTAKTERAFEWPIKYAWQGTYRYPLAKNDGHQWFYYHDEGRAEDSWKIRRSQNGLKMQDTEGSSFCMATTAKAILESKVFETIPTEYKNPLFFPFSNWLAGKNATQHVKKGLSVILNSIVLNATLKSFRILSTFVDSHVTAHVQGLKESEPQWFYLQNKEYPVLREEDMLVVPELFFQLDDGKIVGSKPEQDFKAVAKEFAYVRVLHNYTVRDFHLNKDNVILTLNDAVEMCAYEKGFQCGCIPVPGKPKTKGAEPRDVLSPEVVVESPVVSKALADLSLVWQDRNSKKSVLISAPPGSGKEVFCSGIVYGNGRPTDNFQSLSLARDDQVELEKLLLGDESGGVIRQGLIAKAAKSGLFLDEVHQPEQAAGRHKSAARVALLRPLESGDYIPKGSSTVAKVQDVLFIMATSKSRDELKNFDPPDFWTRMTHFVEIPHPLDIKDGSGNDLDKAKIIEVLAKFFNFFWWDRIESFFEPKDGEDKHLQGCSGQLLGWQKIALRAVLIEGFCKTTVGEQEAKKLRADQPEPARVFAEELLNVLDEQGIQSFECSIRGIRNIVYRLFYISATRVAQGEDVLQSPEEFRNQAKAIAIEIIPLANLSRDAEGTAPANAK